MLSFASNRTVNDEEDEEKEDMKTKLRDYQHEAVKQAVRRVRHGGRVKVLMACGSGKTHVQIGIWEKLQPKRTVVLLPTLALMSQQLRVWQTEAPHAQLGNICCDRRLHPLATEDIAGFVKVGGVLFCTYASSRKLDSMSFDLAIFDEAHQTATVTPKTRMPCYSFALSDDHVRCKRRVFFTATSKGHTARAKDKYDKNKAIFFDMGDAEVYGPKVADYSVAQAINEEVLSDYKIVLAVVTDEEVERAIQSYGAITKPHHELVERVAGYLALGKAVKKYKLKRVFAFVNTRDHAMRLAGAVDDAVSYKDVCPAPGWLGYLTHREVGKAREILGTFAAAKGTAILANPRSLNQGVDVPDTDAVALLANRRSPIDLVQMLGRALRRTPGNTMAHVVIPTFITTSAVGQERRLHTVSDAAVNLFEGLRHLNKNVHADVNLGDFWEDGYASDLTEVIGNPVGITVEDIRCGVQLRESRRGVEFTLQDLRSAVNRYYAEHKRTPRHGDGDAAPYGINLQWPTIQQRVHAMYGSWRRLMVEWEYAELAPSQLTAHQIAEAAKAYCAEHGVPPREKGDSSKYFGFPITWAKIDAALKYGYRGLPKGSSLSKLLRAHGLRKPRTKLTLASIQQKVLAFRKDKGRWPTARRRRIEDASKYFGYSETWTAIDAAMKEGWRGLPGGITLKEFCEAIP